jgi:hypothetical protein
MWSGSAGSFIPSLASLRNPTDHRKVVHAPDALFATEPDEAHGLFLLKSFAPAIEGIFCQLLVTAELLHAHPRCAVAPRFARPFVGFGHGRLALVNGVAHSTTMRRLPPVGKRGSSDAYDHGTARGRSAEFVMPRVCPHRYRVVFNSFLDLHDIFAKDEEIVANTLPHLQSLLSNSSGRLRSCPAAGL